jgi:hypothetical protein
VNWLPWSTRIVVGKPCCRRACSSVDHLHGSRRSRHAHDRAHPAVVSRVFRTFRLAGRRPELGLCPERATHRDGRQRGPKLKLAPGQAERLNHSRQEVVPPACRQYSGRTMWLSRSQFLVRHCPLDERPSQWFRRQANRRSKKVCYVEVHPAPDVVTRPVS